MNRLAILALLSALPLFAQYALPAQEEKVLFHFENDDDLKAWSFKSASDAKLTTEHATHGKKSLKLPLTEQLIWKSDKPMDLSGFESIEMDAFVEGDAPVRVSLIIRDKIAKGNYWDWHNSSHWLKPGSNTLSFPIEGLFRGEAGQNKGDLTSPINPKEIIWFVMTFQTTGKVDALYFDCVRLTKGSRPEGVRAFDFGPESQPLSPGFSPITWNTVYGAKGATAGLKHACGHPNCARDDTFPTRLYRDYVRVEPANAFIADMPNGKCHVWLVFDDCGFWNNEQVRHRKRTIIANGKECWVDDRGDSGPSDYLFRFEHVEPKPGDRMWDLYVKNIFKPARFEAEVTDGKLRIECTTDAWLSTKVAAIIAYPDSVKAAGDKWVEEVEEQNKKEFEANAIFLGPKPVPLDVPAEAKARGYWLGFPPLEEDVSFLDAPGKAEGLTRRKAVKGQRLYFTFAVRPLKDFNGEVALSCAELKGAAGSIPSKFVEPRYVHHCTMRNPNEIAYKIIPHSLRPVQGSALKMSADLTRQFVTIVSIPDDCKPGVYSGEVSLSAGELKLSVPISVEVLDVTLDEPDFFFGFFGAFVPDVLPPDRVKNGWTELGTLLRKNGMNSFSGGPSITFEGLDADGHPKLDFDRCDAFFKEMQALGYTRPMYACGGPGSLVGLHDSYSIGAVGHGWEKKTGKPFKELLKIVWDAVKEHATREGWPTLYRYMIEEPAVVEIAQGTLELAAAYRDAVPDVTFGGFYSINWTKNDPHNSCLQNLFKTAYWSGLNLHNQTDLDKGKEFGREVHIYNQGLSRFSFGAYQWAEMSKGVKGRVQWNLLALYGYQFFDLDAREPDSGVINWGRDEIIPTLNLARCCEGAFDFRIAVTLRNAANKKKGTPESTAALEFLERVNRSIPAGQRTPPKDFMRDEEFRIACLEHLVSLLQK